MAPATTTKGAMSLRSKLAEASEPRLTNPSGSLNIMSGLPPDTETSSSSRKETLAVRTGGCLRLPAPFTAAKPL